VLIFADYNIVHKIFKYILIIIALAFGQMPLSIAQSTSDKMFEVQHNQGADIVKVKVFGNQPNLDKFILMNLIGRNIKEKEYKIGEEFVIFSELATLPTGLYVILARDKNGKLISSVKFYL
jgi:hypothetical protein